MITVNLTYTTGGTPTPSFDTLNSQELLFDAIYYVKNGLNGSGTQVLENEPVIEIPEKKSGSSGLKLVFNGSTPPVIGTAPKRYGNALRSENVPGLQYTSNTFSLKSFPFEVCFVGVDHPCQDYEAYSNVYTDDAYFGNNGNGLRAGDNNLNISGSIRNPLYKVTVTHILYEATGTKLWSNSTLVGTGTRSSRVSRKTLNAILTDTNNVAWDFMAMYQKYGKFSDAERDTIMASITSKWSGGTEVQLPYAYNIAEAYNSGTQTWSVSFSSKNLSGTGINSGATQYNWYLNRRATGAPNGNFTDQVLVGTGSTLPKSAYTSYLSGFSGTYFLKCYVQVQDNAGVKYGFMSSPGYASE